MNATIADGPSAATSSEKIFNVFDSVRKLNKSRTHDMQMVKRIEMDKNPPPPALVAHEANNSQDPGYKELLDTVLARRRAERHQEGEPTESATDSGDPRTKISTEQLDAIKQAVANRSRGGGW